MEKKTVRMKTRDTCDGGHFFCVVHMKKGRLIKHSKGVEGERGAEGRQAGSPQGFVPLYVCLFVVYGVCVCQGRALDWI